MKYLKSTLGFTILLLSFSQAFSRDYFVKIENNSQREQVFSHIQQEIRRELPDFKISWKKAFRSLDEMGLDRVYVIDIPQLRSPVSVRFSSVKGVEYIEAVPEYRISYTPNDYNATLLWHLGKISALQAWNIERGGKGVIVALVDDGMDTAHSDLKPVLWHNTAEIKGNGTDDDGNGYTDDFFGWDVADNDNDPSVVASDNLSHGTHCAGIIGARTDNNNGIAAIGFNIRIMPLKCGQNGQPYIYNGYQGVEYAIENGAQVISMSWGGTSASSTYQTLFDVAYKRNIVCVAAAGNSSTNVKHYPAAYNHVIAVGNTDNNDRKHSSSNYGTWVDVMAPGTGIYSTLPGNSYGTKTGTSMACPMVAGLCALMISRNPSITNSQLESCLKSACDNINSQNSSYTGQIGSGRINALKSLQCVKPLLAQFSSSKRYVCTGDTMRYFDQTLPSSTSRVWSFEGGTPAVSSAQNPIVRYSTPGVYKVQLIAQKGSDADTIEMLSYVTVSKPTAKFSGVQSIRQGEYATLKVDFTGESPWTLIYTDGKSKDTIRSTTDNPYFVLKAPDTTTIYKPVGVSSGSCAGTVSDSAIVKVTKGFMTCDSAMRFHMTFGGNSDDQGWSVRSFDDTMLYIAGRTSSNSKGNFDAFLAKVTVSGKLLWFKSIGGTSEDGFFSVDVDGNGNAYCGGYTYSDVTSRGAFMVKFDSRGNLKWKKYYHGTSHEYIYKVALSPKKDYVYFTGHCSYNGYGSSDAAVYKFDTLGNVQWVKQFGTADQERPYDIVPDDSGNLYVLGVATPSSNMPHVFKVNASGNLVFSKCYTNGGTLSIEYNGGVLWDKKTMFCVGRSFSSSGVLKNIISKMDINGNIAWTREMSLSNIGWPKISTYDKKIIIMDYVTTSPYGIMYVLDSNGNVLKARQVGNGSSLSLGNIDINKDGGLYYAGFQGGGSNNQVVIGRTNCQLDNLCQFNSASISLSNFPLSATNHSMSSKNFTNTTTTSHAAVTQNHSVSIICKSNTSAIKPVNCRIGMNFRIVSNCAGNSVGMADESIDSNNYAINSWFWDFGDGSTTSGSKFASHVYKSTGNYTVQLIVKSSQGTNVCVDTLRQAYQVTDMFTMLSMPKDTTICFGDSVRYASGPLTTCGTAPYSYRWTPTSGVSDTADAQPYFSPKVTTQYKVEITDYNGKKVNGQVKIVVNNSCCKSVARFETVQPSVCHGDSVRFKNTSTYDPNSYYFAWKFTGANISTYIGFEPPPVIFSSAGTRNVQLILSDICSNDTTIEQVLVHELPQADAGRDTVFCKKDTLTIGSEAFGRNIYTWMPSTGLDNPYLSAPTAIVTSAITYRVTVKDEFGCVNTDSVTLKIKPAVISIANDTAICAFDSILLTMPYTGKYLWNTGATTRSVYAKPGTYWGSVEAACNGTDTVVISVKPPGKLFIANDSAICASDSILLTIPGNGKYLWSNNSVNKSIYAKAPGTYWGMSQPMCDAADTVVLTLKPDPVFSLGKDTSFCKNGVLSLQAPVAGNYLWNTGSTVGTINVNKKGIYWLRVEVGGCRSVDSILVGEYALPIFSLGGNRILCRDSIQLKPSVNFNNAKYVWNNGSTANAIKIKSAGTYSLLITDVNNCTYRDTMLVNGGVLPQLSIQDRYKCAGMTYRMQLETKPGHQYTWYDSTTGSFKLFTQEGNYWVKASTACGDTTVNFRLMDSNCQCDVWIPNAFSPNGDARNDIFEIRTGCLLVQYTMTVYTRWGEIVYQTNDPLQGWDGNYKNNIVPLGMYMYTIEFWKELPNHREYQYLKGMIMLVE